MASHTDYLITFLIVIVLTIFKSATSESTHVVGDSLGWTVPPGGSIAYETWSSRQDFEVGDTIVFNWTSSHDVAEVSQDDYDSCTKNNPIGIIELTSPVNITLDSNATLYFICTVANHCELGQKVIIGLVPLPNSASCLAIGAFYAVLATGVIFLLM